jgi:tRNA threonylcarbamoyladenosine biosynthesis protein TsaE
VSEIAVGEKQTVRLEELQSIAEAVWHQVPPGGVVWLTGDLGTGKTAFVQAMTRVAGSERARSPTFALIHEYPAEDGTLIHVDCYRLRSPDEALDLGLTELTAGARITLIEWPERAGVHAPTPDVHLTFEHSHAADRRVLERIR